MVICTDIWELLVLNEFFLQWIEIAFSLKSFIICAFLPQIKFYKNFIDESASNLKDFALLSFRAELKDF